MKNIIEVIVKIKPNKQTGVLALLLLMIFASFAEAVSIGVVMPFLGILISPENIFNNPALEPIYLIFNIKSANELLLPITVIFILATTISAALRLLLLWVQTNFGYTMGTEISSEIFRRTLYQPYHVHILRNSSEMISAISTKTNITIQHALLPFLNLITSFILLFFILIVLLWIDPMVALLTFFGFGFLYSIVAIFTKKRLLIESERISIQSNKVTKIVQEGLSGIRDILIDGTQKYYFEMYRKTDLNLRRAQSTITIVGAAPRFIVESVGMAIIGFLAYYLSSSKGGIENAIPVLGALAVGAQRMLPILQLMYHNWSSIRGSHSSVADVLDLLKQDIPKNNKLITGSDLKEFKDSIALVGVYFKYDNRSKYVLENINFEILKGQRVGIVGPTGGGKSTLIDLVMGLIQPSSGEIYVDGVKFTNLNEQAWQSHIAHVPQSIFLTDSTIEENIAFGIGREKINIDRVKKSAKLAKISDYIDSLPARYKTIVGERGVRLSGGQRQRIGIARALYKESDVIIFDEATSALDGDTESAVMAAINNISRDITIIIIAHRLSTLKKCDLIFEVKERGLVKVDSIDSLSK